jgi:hypothetical protein
MIQIHLQKDFNFAVVTAGAGSQQITPKCGQVED